MVEEAVIGVDAAEVVNVEGDVAACGRPGAQHFNAGKVACVVFGMVKNVPAQPVVLLTKVGIACRQVAEDSTTVNV